MLLSMFVHGRDAIVVFVLFCVFVSCCVVFADVNVFVLVCVVFVVFGFCVSLFRVCCLIHSIRYVIG